MLRITCKNYHPSRGCQFSSLFLVFPMFLWLCGLFFFISPVFSDAGGNAVLKYTYRPEQTEVVLLKIQKETSIYHYWIPPVFMAFMWILIHKLKESPLEKGKTRSKLFFHNQSF